MAKDMRIVDAAEKVMDQLIQGEVLAELPSHYRLALAAQLGCYLVADLIGHAECYREIFNKAFLLLLESHGISAEDMSALNQDTTSPMMQALGELLRRNKARDN